MRVRVTAASVASHIALMRGVPELVDRSDTGQDPELARRLWTLSEELIAVRPRI